MGKLRVQSILRRTPARQLSVGRSVVQTADWYEMEVVDEESDGEVSNFIVDLSERE